MAVVKDYMHGACRIIVRDDYYAGRTVEERKEDRKKVHDVARQVVMAKFSKITEEVNEDGKVFRLPHSDW